MDGKSSNVGSLLVGLIVNSLHLPTIPSFFLFSILNSEVLSTPNLFVSLHLTRFLSYTPFYMSLSSVHSTNPTTFMWVNHTYLPNPLPYSNLPSTPVWHPPPLGPLLQRSDSPTLWRRRALKFLFTPSKERSCPRSGLSEDSGTVGILIIKSTNFFSNLCIVKIIREGNN